MQSYLDVRRLADIPMPAVSNRRQRLDTSWQLLTEDGNQALDGNNHAEAIWCHGNALAEAKRMSAAALEGKSPLLPPMVYNISSANQADAMARIGNLRAACDPLLAAFDKLIDTAAAAKVMLGSAAVPTVGVEKPAQPAALESTIGIHGGSFSYATTTTAVLMALYASPTDQVLPTPQQVSPDCDVRRFGPLLAINFFLTGLMRQAVANKVD